MCFWNFSKFPHPSPWRCCLSLSPSNWRRLWEELGCLCTSLDSFPVKTPSFTLEPEVGFYSDKSADNKDEFGHTDSKTRVHIMPLKIDFTQLGHIMPLPCPVFSNWCYVPVIPFYIWKPLGFLFLQTILAFLFSQEGLEELLNIVFAWLQVCIMALERKLVPHICGWWRPFRAHDVQWENPKNLFKAWL